jgi:CelD/BcsL family acetyltransferase involved in cellulose biosynthesis
VTTTVDVYQRCGPLAPAWDELADEVGASPYLRAGWIDRWWLTLGRGRLELVALRRAGELVGVAPLYRSQGVLRTVCNDNSAEMGFLAVDERAATDLAAAVLDRVTSRVCLVDVDTALPGFAECERLARRRGMPVVADVVTASPWIDLAGGIAGVDARLGGSTRRGARRARRLLEERGGVTVEVCDGTTGLDAALREGFAVEASGWKGRNGSAITSRPHTEAFYRGVARWAAEQGWLTVALLRLDGRAVGFVLDITVGGRTHGIKTGFDEALASCSPGTVVLHDALARACSRGSTRYHMGGPMVPFKKRWSSGADDVGRLRVFATSPAGRAGHLALERGVPAAARASAWAGRAGDAARRLVATP